VLESNNLRGHLPACLGELGHLKVLRLCSNQLAGGIPQEIGGCKALRELVLNQNELTGKCMQHAGGPSTRAHHGARARSRRAQGTAHGTALTAAQTPAQTALAALGASPATPARVVTLLVCNRDLVWCCGCGCRRDPGGDRQVPTADPSVVLEQPADRYRHCLLPLLIAVVLIVRLPSPPLHLLPLPAPAWHPRAAAGGVFRRDARPEAAHGRREQLRRWAAPCMCARVLARSCRRPHPPQCCMFASSVGAVRVLCDGSGLTLPGCRRAGGDGAFAAPRAGRGRAGHAGAGAPGRLRAAVSLSLSGESS
jgi:hypothetical protein